MRKRIESSGRITRETAASIELSRAEGTSRRRRINAISATPAANSAATARVDGHCEMLENCINLLLRISYVVGPMGMCSPRLCNKSTEQGGEEL